MVCYRSPTTLNLVSRSFRVPGEGTIDVGEGELSILPHPPLSCHLHLHILITTCLHGLCNDIDGTINSVLRSCCLRFSCVWRQRMARKKKTDGCVFGLIFCFDSGLIFFHRPILLLDLLYVFSCFLFFAPMMIFTSKGKEKERGQKRHTPASRSLHIGS